MKTSLVRIALIPAVLALGSLVASSAGRAQEPPPSEKSQPAEAATPEKPAKPADPFAVPDGGPKELLKHIETVAETQARSIEELNKVAESIIAAADRIVEHKESADEQVLSAIEWKFMALGAMSRYGDEAAGKKLRALAESLKDDKRPAIASLAHYQLLMQRVDSVAEADAKEQADYLADVLAYFKAHELTRRNASLLVTVPQILEMGDDHKLAMSAYEQLGELAAKSDDGFLARSVRQEFEPRIERLAMIGKPIEISGTTLDGKSFDLAQHKGKVVLVDFWATWCGPCVAEVPNVKENYGKYHERGFEVVGISLDSRREKLETFLDENEIPWTNLFSDDPKESGWEHPLAKKYNVSAIPTVLLVGRDGKVVSINARGERLGRLLAQLLGDAPETAAEK